MNGRGVGGGEYVSEGGTPVKRGKGKYNNNNGGDRQEEGQA